MLTNTYIPRVNDLIQNTETTTLFLVTEVLAFFEETVTPITLNNRNNIEKNRVIALRTLDSSTASNQTILIFSLPFTNTCELSASKHRLISSASYETEAVMEVYTREHDPWYPNRTFVTGDVAAHFVLRGYTDVFVNDAPITGTRKQQMVVEPSGDDRQRDPLTGLGAALELLKNAVDGAARWVLGWLGDFR